MKPLLYLPWDDKFKGDDQWVYQPDNSLFRLRDTRKSLGREIRNLENRVSYLLKLWFHATNPFELDPMKHLYLPSMTKEVRAARQYILDSGHGDMFKEHRSVAVNILTPEGRVQIDVTLDQKEKVWTVPPIDADRLHPEVFAYLSRYAMNVAEAATKREAIEEHVRVLLKHMTTYGQLFTVWPDLYGFVGSEISYSVGKRKAKSALNEKQRNLYGVRPEHIAYSTYILAEAYMLDVAGVEVDNFRGMQPTFWAEPFWHIRNKFTQQYLEVYPQHTESK